ncbi:hypothetical protein D0Y65_054940 [Glycine soja]|uniref:Uncharacterized protein n=1 Tax=Glycine soja TaxID=3848 RepID=A0A445F974_GLYSO|nr:hypothetical protein D0Y65_054940 [Glycine soja]
MATNTFTGALLSERCLRLNLNKRLPKESALVPVAFALCLKNDTMMNFVATLTLLAKPYYVMQAPWEFVGLGSSSSMDSFASWKINGSGMGKEEREETPLQGEDESRRSSPP